MTEGPEPQNHRFWVVVPTASSSGGSAVWGQVRVWWPRVQRAAGGGAVSAAGRGRHQPPLHRDSPQLHHGTTTAPPPCPTAAWRRPAPRHHGRAAAGLWAAISDSGGRSSRSVTQTTVPHPHTAPPPARPHPPR